MSGTRHSQLTYALMMLTAAPLIVAVNFFDTIDWSPWLLLLGLGLALTWLFRQVLARLQARVRRTTAALTAGEVAPEHAPGGLFLWFAVPAWTIGLGLILNVALDGSPPEEHPSTIVQLTNGKGARITFRDFRPGGDTISLLRNKAALADPTPGRPVTLVTHPGFFGWPWLAEIR